MRKISVDGISRRGYKDYMLENTIQSLPCSEQLFRKSIRTTLAGAGRTYLMWVRQYGVVEARG